MAHSWSLVESHGLVLFYIASKPDTTMREVSQALDLTERRVSQIIGDLSESGLIDVEKRGRRNTYSINRDASFRHPTLSHIKLGEFEELLLSAHREPVAAGSR